MTPVLVLITTFVLAVCFALILSVLLRLRRLSNNEEFSVDWLKSFSVERYRPMQGLLDEEDFSFLSRQPGFDLALYKKLRRERLRIFRQYLNRLIADFHRLHAGARAMLATTPGEHSEVLLRLVRLNFHFTLAVFRAEGNYLLCCVGFRTLAVRALIGRLEEMTAQASVIMALQAAEAVNA